MGTEAGSTTRSTWLKGFSRNTRETLTRSGETPEAPTEY
jgi:hypothetical protein